MSRQKRATALLTTDAMRFIKIERCLRSGAADFEQLRGCVEDVSPATLKRDLKAMREELGAPILYERARGLYRLASEWGGVAACLVEQVGHA